MKTYIFLICAALTLIVACERKTELDPKVTITPSVVIQKNSESLPVSSPNEAPKKVLQTGGIKVQEEIKASSVSAGQSMNKSSAKAPQEAKVSTEQSLADTVDHAREVTKSQVSGSRKRADKAESEMDDMLKNK
jgi:hypothetical protein